MANVLGETPAIDAHHNPSVGKQNVRLLEKAHIFVSEVRQAMSVMVVILKLPHTKQSRTDYSPGISHIYP